MPINQSTLREYSSVRVAQKTVTEAARAGSLTAFLSHSHKDATLAKGVQAYLNRMGWDVYIDWEDHSMPERPNRVTADKIRRKIVELDLFLLLATANSMTSRWCPWELGYADGRKDNSSILVIQTRDDYGTIHGNEYLELYKHIDNESTGGIGAFDQTGYGIKLMGSVRPR